MSRRTELHRRRVRRKKLAKLRTRYHTADTQTVRAAVLERIVKLAPRLALELREKADAPVPEEKAAAPRTDTVVKKRAKAARGEAPTLRPGATEGESEGVQSRGGAS